MKFLFEIFFAVFLISYVHSDLTQVNEVQFNDLIKKNKLVLAYIRRMGECGETCQEDIKVLSSLEPMAQQSGIKIVETENDKMIDFWQLKGPKLIYFRNGAPLLYQEEITGVDELLDWSLHNQEITCQILDDSSFEHLTQASSGSTTGDWFVLFYSEECPENLLLWETLASKLKHQKMVAKVNFGENPELKKRFKITNCPTSLFFHNGKYYPYNLKPDFISLVNFAEGWYKNAPSHSVPPVGTPFDKIVDGTVTFLKRYISEDFFFITVIILSLLLGVLISGAIIKKICYHDKKKN